MKSKRIIALIITVAFAVVITATVIAFIIEGDKSLQHSESLGRGLGFVYNIFKFAPLLVTEIIAYLSLVNIVLNRYENEITKGLNLTRLICSALTIIAALLMFVYSEMSGVVIWLFVLTVLSSVAYSICKISSIFRSKKKNKSE